MREFLKAYVKWLRSLPDAFGEWCERFVADAHRPVWPDDDLQWPGDPVEPPCARCKRPWPCEDFVKASDRLAEYRGKAG